MLIIRSGIGCLKRCIHALQDLGKAVIEANEKEKAHTARAKRDGLEPDNAWYRRHFCKA